jgi:hypothetical protein
MNNIINYSNISSKYVPHFISPDEETITTKIGGTVYEITSHFNTKGSESVLKQFMDLLLADTNI